MLGTDKLPYVRTFPSPFPPGAFLKAAIPGLLWLCNYLIIITLVVLQFVATVFDTVVTSTVSATSTHWLSQSVILQWWYCDGKGLNSSWNTQDPGQKQDPGYSLALEILSRRSPQWITLRMCVPCTARAAGRPWNALPQLYLWVLKYCQRGFCEVWFSLLCFSFCFCF